MKQIFILLFLALVIATNAYTTSNEIKQDYGTKNFEYLEFPQIQQYLDKVNKIGDTNDKSSKMLQNLNGKTFTSIENGKDEDLKLRCENIPWNNFSHVEYSTLEIKEYTGCEFKFKSNFKETTKYGTLATNFFICFILTKDMQSVKEAIETFQHNEIYKNIGGLESTEGSLFKDARTWNVISSLMGNTLDNTKIIAKKNGMSLFEGGDDKDMGLTLHGLIPSNAKTPENQSIYNLGFKNGKVSLIMVDYNYSKESKLDSEKDLLEIKKQLELSGFEFIDKKHEKHNSSFGGASWVNFRYFFLNSKNKKEVRIFQDVLNFSFLLTFGEKNYLDKIEAINKE